ncbi:MAG: sigma-70 family RNA polymerase sigma factor [Bacteroidota bacterium]
MTEKEIKFTETYNEHAMALRNFMYYKTGDLEAANDYAQESFTRYWQNYQKVQPTKVKSYLFKVASNLHLDQVGREKVKLKFQNRTKSNETYMETNPEYLYRSDEFKQRLQAAISRLPEHRRTIFLMSRMDKFKNKEIAETLNLSIKTIEKHIATALKELKCELDDLVLLKI